MKSPIRKLLVLTNQSSSGILICFTFYFYSYKKGNTEPYIRRFIFIFKVSHVFMEQRDNPVEKVVIDEEELDGIEIDNILNSENLPRAVCII